MVEGLSLIFDRATSIAMLVAASVAIAAFALPLKLNILVAIAAAVVAGLVVESLERRKKSARTPVAASDEAPP
jgi:predicted branched-subunit amino acid permease